MAEPKTIKNKASVRDFLNTIPDEKKRRDSFAILKLMQDVTREKPAMWGTSIVGFGTYRYTYASGREGDWPLTGFSPRKPGLSIYIVTGFDNFRSLMSRLGKFKTGRGCLYIKTLEDVNLVTLRQLIKRSVAAKSSEAKMKGLHT